MRFVCGLSQWICISARFLQLFFFSVDRSSSLIEAYGRPNVLVDVCRAVGCPSVQ